MVFIEWNDQLSVGIKEIDDQHKKLIEMIATFYDHLQKDNKSALTELLNSMAQYTVKHFRTEERYFDLYNYPDAIAHKQEHELFVKEVESVQKRLAEGKPVLSLELTNFIKKWVTDHILGSDKKYGPFLNSKGLK